MLRTKLITFAGCGAALCAAIGCNDGASSRPVVQSLPAEGDAEAVKPKPARAEEQGSAPHGSQPAESTKGDDSSEDESAKLPKLPDYLTILERIDERAAVRVTEQKAESPRLVIETHNVRRLRINRSQLSFAGGRSIPLRIDGQVFEMRASSEAVELERSRNGEWSSVKKSP